MEEIQVENSLYDDDGGDLSINFTNTVNWRGDDAAREDNLGTYQDVLVWCDEAGLLDGAERARLVERSQADPAGAETALVEIREIREVIYRILRNLGEAQLPSPADQSLFNDTLHRALGHRRLDIQPAHARWAWRSHSDDLTAPIWPVVLAAADLAVSDDLAKVHTCSNEACGWMFLDRSRNQSRKWCSSESCGNRARVRKFYQHSKTTSARKTG